MVTALIHLAVLAALPLSAAYVVHHRWPHLFEVLLPAQEDQP
jgi:hypothetical protein